MKTIRVEMDQELYDRVIRDQSGKETSSEAVCRILWDGLRGDPEAISQFERAKQLLLRLRRSGLVRSTRGVMGGYELARLPGQLTVADVYKVVVGSGVHRPITPGKGRVPTICEEVWDSLDQAIMDNLDLYTISELAESQRKGKK